MWQPGWEGSWGRRDTLISMAESLHCWLDSITTLLIGHTPIQNRKFFKIKILRVTKEEDSIEKYEIIKVVT